MVIPLLPYFHFSINGELIVYTERNDMSTTFLQQILSGKLLLVVIVGVKK